MMDLTSEQLAEAARSAAGAGSIGFRIGSSATVSYAVDGDTVVMDGSLGGAETVVGLDEEAWDDLTAQVRTAINLFLSKELTFERGGFEQLMRWDPALRLLHAGIPIYDPTRADLHGRDPHAVMTLADSDEDLAAQLDTMGYLHLRGVFTAEEMAAANAEVDRLADEAAPGDDRSWWAIGDDGREVLCRLIYATLRSQPLAAVEQDARVSRLGRLLDPTAWLASDRMEGSPVLLKVPGNTKGLSNIPWHQDCGMGGHAIICPSVTIGIQLTGSSAATGNLQVIPGSHGQTLYYGWDREPGDVPVVDIDTEPGDVTVHVQDVMHASPRPTGHGGRRTFYVTFYPPTLRDQVGPGEAFNDLVRNRTAEVDRLRGRD